MFSSHVCEIINITSVNTSIYLHSVTSLRAENIVISNAVSVQSMMIIEKCTGVLSNFRAENSTATASGKVIVKVLNSILHIKGSMYAVNNTSVLQMYHPTLILMKNTSLQISAHLIFTKNTNLYIWKLYDSYTKFQHGELAIYHNFDLSDILFLYECTLYIEQEAKIDISNNTSRKNVTSLIVLSFLEVHGTTNIYNNFAQDLLRVTTSSTLTLSGNTSFVNNVNFGSDLDIIGGCVIYIRYNSFLYTNATVTFDNNTGQSGSGIISVESSYLEFNGITTFVNNYATDAGGAIHIYQYDVPPLGNISIHFQGLTLFANNSAARGGAIHCQGENISISFTGNPIFTNNRANLYGAHLTFHHCKSCIANFNGNTKVEKGVSFYGGIIATGNTSVAFNGVNIFTQNSATLHTGNIQAIQGAKFQCYGNNIFTGNEGGVFMFQDNATFVISGTTLFSENFNPAGYGTGAILVFSSSGILKDI